MGAFSDDKFLKVSLDEVIVVFAWKLDAQLVPGSLAPRLLNATSF